MTPSRARTYLIPICASLVIASVATAAPGDPDKSFGKGGLVYADSATQAALEDVVALDSGVLSMSGTAADVYESPGWTVRRWNDAGDLDTSYGDRGAAVEPASWRLSSPQAARLDQDGKLVVVGAQLGEEDAHGRWAVVRYTPAGQPDVSFSSDGLQTVKFLSSSGPAAQAVVRDRRGGYVVAGGAIVRRPDRSLAFVGGVARLRADGSRDRSFGDRGLVRLRELESVRFTSDSKQRAVLAFTRPSQSKVRQIVLTRLAPDGRPDRSFAAAGRRRIDVGAMAAVNGLTSAHRRLFLALSVGRKRGGRPVVMRLKLNGEVDQDFGRRGRASLPDAGGRNTVITDLAIDSRGRIVAAGWTGPRLDESRPMVARLKRSGALDRSFGSRGIAILKRAPSPITGVSVALTEDGEVYVGGSAGEFRFKRTFLGRLFG